MTPLMRVDLVAEAAICTTYNKHNRRTPMPSVRFKSVFSTFWIGDCCQDEAVEHSRIEWGQHPLLRIFRMVSLTSRRLLKLLSYCVMSLVTCRTCVIWTVHRWAYEGQCGFAVRMVLRFKENCAPGFKWKWFSFVCITFLCRSARGWSSDKSPSLFHKHRILSSTPHRPTKHARLGIRQLLHSPLYFLHPDSLSSSLFIQSYHRRRLYITELYNNE